ncbi:MAG TPA: 50S ribosomal protein L25/general stress protein Ctc [Magnetococcales bacterium]|nr:50S ribosomal protein L25/general stress protein Ctc [Magnetococcales bacterium]
MALIKATKRDGTGKGVARQLRRDGRIPAVLYGGGKGKGNVNLALELRAFLKTLEVEGSNIRVKVIDLNIEGVGNEKVLMRGLQIHPVSGWPEHVDFMRFDAHQKIQVMIPVHVMDEDQCPGLRDGGILQLVQHELDIHCQAGAIPEAIHISIKGLEIGHSVHLRDIQLPPGSEVYGDQSMTIVSIVGVKAEQAEDMDVAVTETALDGASASTT